MPTCSKCHPVYDLGRICPHQGPEELLQLVDAYRNVDQLHMRQRDAYRDILTDLIAELVGDDGDGHEMTPDGEACAVCVAIDRAEVRLREVTGDE